MIFADKDNHIDFAVCVLWEGHSEAMLRSLITECMIRAMGLPFVARNSDDTALDSWNRAHEPYALLKKFDGDEATYERYQKQVLEPNMFLKHKTPSSGQREDFFKLRSDFYNSITDYSTLRSELSDYDKFMLKMLYQPRLRAGITKEQAKTILEN